MPEDELMVKSAGVGAGRVNGTLGALGLEAMIAFSRNSPLSTLGEPSPIPSPKHPAL